MGAKFNGIVFVTILAFGGALAQIPDDDCPFTPGANLA
jgi:hypothetical protein